MQEISERVMRCVIERLELSLDTSQVRDDQPLSEVLLAGGIELDSLSAIEIVVAICMEFGIQVDEVPKEVFQSVTTLSDFVRCELDKQGMQA